MQQEYHDAPLRAQIAGLTTRPQPRPQQPQPPQAGPATQSVQAFLPPSQAQDPRLRAALQSGDPSLSKYSKKVAKKKKIYTLIFFFVEKLKQKKFLSLSRVINNNTLFNFGLVISYVRQ